MVRALKAAQATDASHPELHRLLVSLSVALRKRELNAKVRCLAEEEVAALLGKATPDEYNQRFLARHGKDSISHLVAGTLAKYV